MLNQALFLTENLISVRSVVEQELVPSFLGCFEVS